MKPQLTLALALLLTTSQTFADSKKEYEVSITNITKGQSFTPVFFATHDSSNSAFSLGAPASVAVERLAEGGDTAMLATDLASASGETHTMPAASATGLLEPGMTTTVQISGHHWEHSLTVMAMLLPTNDTFVALSGVELPKKGSMTYLALAYDAGTEANDQLCANIPGPVCHGTPFSDPSATDEGFIYISNGFHDIGELAPMMYDWRNPIAQITVTRIK